MIKGFTIFPSFFKFGPPKKFLATMFILILNSVLKWPPWLSQCPETNTEQKTIKKPCGFCQGPQPAKRMDAGKVAEGGFL